jgi:hydroxyacyl-ACP dehydratase HTD2-like protein with hotdog domain
VSDLAALQAVARAGGPWLDDVEVATGVADPDRLALLADVLDGPAPEAEVPPMWPLVLTTGWPAHDNLGLDGHPVAGVGYPPLPDRRRLFAGGRLTVHAPLQVGAAVTRTTQATGVRAAEGRTGPLLFVTVRHSFADGDGRPLAIEEHDLAYRSGTAASVPDARTGGDAADDAEFALLPDAVTLFRFSVLTGNSHRIHYDERYATETEGLPGRLVHGPLLALLLLELPRRRAPELRVTSFSFRLLRPVTLGARVGVRHREDVPGRWVVEATADGARCADGEIVLAEGMSH